MQRISKQTPVTELREQHIYIYSLRFEEVVFYIGKTLYPRQRIDTHLSGQDLNTGSLIGWIKHLGKCPTIKIESMHNNYEEAEKAEISLIKEYVSNKHPLCNNEHNPSTNKIIMPSTKGINTKGRWNLIDRQAITKYVKSL